MAKKLKTIAQEDSRKRSREMDKYRKRLKRAKNRVEKKISSGEFKSAEEMKRATDYVQSLSDTIQGTYAKKVEGKYEYQQGVEKLSKVTRITMARETISQGEIIRKDEIWKRKFNQATKKGGVSSLSEQEARSFFRATEPLWNKAGVNIAARFDKIKEQLGVDTIEQAYKLISQSKIFKELKESSENLVDGSRDEIDEQYKEIIMQMNKLSQEYRNRGLDLYYETE